MLRTHNNKERTPGNWNDFKKQRNKCVKLLRQPKRDYYGNLNEKSITDNRKFLEESAVFGLRPRLSAVFGLSSQTFGPFV